MFKEGNLIKIIGEKYKDTSLFNTVGILYFKNNNYWTIADLESKKLLSEISENDIKYIIKGDTVLLQQVILNLEYDKIFTDNEFIKLILLNDKPCNIHTIKYLLKSVKYFNDDKILEDEKCNALVWFVWDKLREVFRWLYSGKLDHMITIIHRYNMNDERMRFIINNFTKFYNKVNNV